MKRGSIGAVVLLAMMAWGAGARGDEVLLEDDFGSLPRTMFSSGVIGAEAEYHYLPATAPKGNWAVACFVTNAETQRAWRVVEEEGRSLMKLFYGADRGKPEFHPLIVTGDPLWRDYAVNVRLAPDSGEGRCGVAFRYQNNRCYYFFGVEGDKAVLKLVKHATAFHKPFEKTLAEKACSWKPGQFLTVSIRVAGKRIEASIDGIVSLSAEDETFSTGKVGLTSDVPARYARVTITATTEEKKRVEEAIAAREREWAALQAANPRMVLWKKLNTKDFGVGRNLRFGDLDGDGTIDVLIGQMQQHGPKDSHAEISCLTAMTFEGKVLWQSGLPDAWNNHLTNDVAFQIHDIDGDGRNEVVYCKDFQIIIADGATGQVKRKAPTPLSPKSDGSKRNRFERILGDSMFFCDLRGLGRPGDMIVKDRYENLWAYNEQLEPLWHVACNTGHYPYAYDVDRDGKDEVLTGYSMIDDDGKVLWSLDQKLKDHADGVAMVKFRPDAEPMILCAASDEGIFFADAKGQILKHHHLGHVQNPAIANFREDLPGLEAVSINFWGNQGIIHVFDADGNVIHSFEPCHHGSMCLPLNWTGGAEEYFVLSPNVAEGGVFDARGRRVVAFPADGHPEMCNAVLDLTGDGRDEIVVWDPHEIWVYTQSDNPKAGPIYKPVRSALYNYSNYQATVSVPAAK